MNKRTIITIVAVIAASALMFSLFLARDDVEDELSDPTMSADAGGAGTPAQRGEISGTVVGPMGEPIIDATVVVGDAEVTTGEDGEFAVEDLEPGTYEVDATADGRVSPGPAPLRSVEVTLADDGSAVEDLQLVLREPATLSGKVVAGDEPVQATLGLYYLDAEGPTGEPLPPFSLDDVAQSNPDGEFVIDNVAPGRLRVLAAAEDYALGESREFLIHDGEDLPGITIDLLPSGTLAGKVLDTEGEPIADAEVVVRGEPLLRSRRRTTNERGGFRFDRLPAGVYAAHARAAGYRSEKREELELTVEEPVVVELVMEPGEGFFGKVLAPDGKPAKRAFVIARTDAKRPKVVKTNADGAFQWEEAPAKLQATAVSPHYGPDGPKQNEEGSTTFRLGEGGYVSGHVVGPDGDPLSSYTIAVESFDVDGPTPYSNRVFEAKRINRSDGAFEYGPLRPGTYYFRARANNVAPGSSDAVRVTAGGTADGVTIRLGSGATVQGTVTSADGEPVAGASVTVFDVTNPFSPKKTRTDRQGHFELEGVPAGRRSLRVGAKGYLTQVASGLDVPEGGTATRDVELTKAKPGQKFSFHGIGAVLQKEGEGVKIREVMEGKPAAVFGLQKDDVILAVDREPTDEMRLGDVVELIRGQKGVPVELEVDRPGEGRMTLEVERGRVIVKGKK